MGTDVTDKMIDEDIETSRIVYGIYKNKDIDNNLKELGINRKSGFNMEGVMKYYNTGDNITYWDRQTGKVAVAVTYWLSYSTQDYYVTSGGTVRRLRKGSQYLDSSQ